MNVMWFMVVLHILKCPVSEFNQRALRMGRLWLRRVVVPQEEEDDTNAEESGYKDSVAEESNEQEEESSIRPEARSKIWFLQGSRDVYYEGLNINEKGYPSRSFQEEPKMQFNALNERKKASSKTAIKKEPVLDSVRVRAIRVDISERTITRVLMGGNFTVPTKTTEYDYRMEAMKERAEWITGRKPIYKASLNFLAKSWWSIVRHRFASKVNDNALSADRATLVA
ncbi:hypothetical protein HAX54_036170, partial [Datura stramonium]|nr:hypothetical protein [Datura stramonium]